MRRAAEETNETMEKKERLSIWINDDDGGKRVTVSERSK
jgi:outer membrane lipoprotein SlyB